MDLQNAKELCKNLPDLREFLFSREVFMSFVEADRKGLIYGWKFDAEPYLEDVHSSKNYSFEASLGSSSVYLQLAFSNTPGGQYAHNDELENYIRKHFHKFKPQDLQIIVKFDQCMDLIHDDMAKLKTSLSLHLKRYEENLVMQKKSDCLAIFDTCKQFINNNVRANLVHDYVDMLLFDEEIREEARGKLKGQSMKKYICEMVAALRWFDVFRNDVTPHMFASAISKKMAGVESKTLQTYIEKFYNAREGRLYEWTKANIEQLKKAPYNPFALII